ncbi:F-box protein [Wickerhamomyces ciferrii]|uniref:F-box protein n=1 Tax=Wickerhamomyces ciferrii (strain ATCC 14091 / BCRC 22168 / CBS 111 / JCM 3599 / NBRC 0793 / NRRL Y-1031 F-60-10) TaxID=1206466 RepID=K0KQF7_WICCF|nr:F-box protein [Wickerhamomyces ciferrii]CCH44387.1 F-box protein [Wickerhamomyces ciferrii]
MAQTISQTPFSKSYKDINIVNNNYNHYGNSILTNHSKSILTNHSYQSTTHSTNSYNTIHHQDDDDHDDQIIELNSNNFTKRKFNYKSLIPESTKVKKFLKNLDQDSFSIFSTRSQTTKITINSLPFEIFKNIAFFVSNDYKSMINLLYVNKQFYKAIKPFFYNDPMLTSTYRVAQLITSLRQFPENGLLIKKLDLSNLKPGNYEHGVNDDQTDDDAMDSYALASWRDWKYRGDPLYGSTMLNSYNLFKSKSSSSLNSNTSSINKLNKFKYLDDMNIKFKHLLIFWKKNIRPNGKKRSRSLSSSKLFNSNSIKKTKNIELIQPTDSVKLDTSNTNNTKIQFRNPKNQPFIDHHPYTNKFLLKYSNSNDLPIGYIFYFIDLCPNLTSLNLSKVSLSIDFKIIYPKPGNFKFSSLVEDVLSINNSTQEESLLPFYLSDSNIYFNIKTFQNHFQKIWESDILLKLTQLQNLKNLNLSSISWLNFKTLREFKLNSLSIQNQSLTEINLLNSGMIRNLNWAKNFSKIDEFNDYFQNDVEPEQPQQENIMRNVGMNY